MGDFGILGSALEAVSVGVLLLSGTDIIYSNSKARDFLDEFTSKNGNPVEYLLGILNTTSSNGVGSCIKGEIRLIDGKQQERYVSVEINRETEPTTILVVDVTEQNIQSLTDELTGIGNRARYELTVSELEAASVFPVSIIEGDVNGLKLTNDLFGHETGDTLIKKVSSILERCVRKDVDTLCRWGGDEFVLILPNADLKVAKLVCNRIEQYCRSSKLEPLTPSLSLGYATTEYRHEPLSKVLERAESMMYKDKLAHAPANRMKTLDTLRVKLSKYSYETLAHSERLREIMIAFGEYLKMSSNDIATLAELAYYHDIGMASLPKDFLLKDGVYTESDWKIMRTHVHSGYLAVKAIPEFVNLATPILHHHESWDGSGYPKGLKGEQIDPLARILRIGDSFEVMTSPSRKYGQIKTVAEALEDLRYHANQLYEQELVKKFIEMILTTNAKHL